MHCLEVFFYFLITYYFHVKVENQIKLEKVISITQRNNINKDWQGTSILLTAPVRGFECKIKVVGPTG